MLLLFMASSIYYSLDLFKLRKIEYDNRVSLVNSAIHTNTESVTIQTYSFHSSNLVYIGVGYIPQEDPILERYFGNKIKVFSK